jgi:hypothetical protein
LVHGTNRSFLFEFSLELATFGPGTVRVWHRKAAICEAADPVMAEAGHGQHSSAIATGRLDLAANDRPVPSAIVYLTAVIAWSQHAATDRRAQLADDKGNRRQVAG